MSLKAIELQIALPRTHDAGKIQNEIQHRGQIIQDQVLEQVQKEQERKRTIVNKNESKDNIKNNNMEKQPKDHQHERSKKQKNEDTPEIKHPYKGTKVDFSG